MKLDGLIYFVYDSLIVVMFEISLTSNQGINPNLVDVDCVCFPLLVWMFVVVLN